MQTPCVKLFPSVACYLLQDSMIGVHYCTSRLRSACNPVFCIRNWLCLVAIALPCMDEMWDSFGIAIQCVERVGDSSILICLFPFSLV